MLGKWDALYNGADLRRPYGDVLTYVLGGAFLAGLAVEDWGCGLGWFKKYASGPYLGIDGSASPFADVIADLRDYRSTTPGLFLRHVLEHNTDWKRILENALASFEQRMVLVVFTPFSDYTHVIAENDWAPGVRIPDISFAMSDLTSLFSGWLVTEESLDTSSQYGQEHVFFLDKQYKENGGPAGDETDA